jgi:hypothetical protein
MIDELPFKVVRSNGSDEVLARAISRFMARATKPRLLDCQDGLEDAGLERGYDIGRKNDDEEDK